MELLKEEIKIQEITIKENNQDVKLYYCYTNKFKTFYTRCVFLLDFNHEQKPVNTVLSYLLDRTTSKHPVEEEFIGYLFNNYDMFHDVGVSTSGLTDKFSFSTGTVNSKYVHEDINLLNIALDVLKETIYYPNFDKEIFEEIKASLVENIINKQNNKVSVAYNNFINTMFKDEVFNKKVIRNPSLFSNITLNDVEEVYKKLIKSEHFYVYIGEDCLEDVVNGFSSFNLTKEIPCKYESIDKETKEVKEVEYIVEDFDVNQSHIFMGYRTNIFTDHDDYYPMHIFNIMFGGSSTSELFEIVREEHGLAYNISSTYSPSKGFVMIDGGISKDNYDKTKTLIDQIITKYQNGEIDEDKLNLTKGEIISDIKSGLDSINTTIETAILYALFGSMSTAKEKIDKINSVTVKDIQRVANSLVLDTVYFMRGTK